jgi:signal transduction histidine kinase/CheY-like chemotaxis protein
MSVQSFLDRVQPLPDGTDREVVRLELLKTLDDQAQTAMPPVVFSSLMMGGMALGNAPIYLVVLWTAAIILFQPFRMRFIRTQLNDEANPVKARLANVVRLSFVHGVLASSSIVLFYYMDGTSRAIYTMMMATICGAAVTTSNGFAGPCIRYVLPILLMTILGWLLFPLDGAKDWVRYGIVILLFMYIGFLVKHAGQTFTWFIDRIKITNELQRSLKAEKLASSAKTRFLAAASHDLRQPLHTMSLLSAALTMRPLDEKSSAIARNMNEAMRDLTSELDSLLDISKLDAGVVEVDRGPVSVNKILDRLVRSYLVPAHEKGLEVELNAAAIVTVDSDKVLLDRLFRNLLDNAIKYTNKGKIQVDLERSGDYCVVRIQDSGIGVEAAKQDRIFEEFFQVGNPERDRRQGLGLGLSIVSRIANILDIDIGFESTMGVGSQFTLTIPFADVTATEKPSPIRTRSEIEGAQIILVEDDAGVRFATEAFLAEAGCIVTSAAGTNDALSTLTAKSKPDVVIADIRLPEGDSGINAIGRLRDRLPGLAAILVTGESSEDGLSQARDLGVTLLKKPVEQESLIREIARLLTTSRQQA